MIFHKAAILLFLAVGLCAAIPSTDETEETLHHQENADHQNVAYVRPENLGNRAKREPLMNLKTIPHMMRDLAHNLGRGFSNMMQTGQYLGQKMVGFGTSMVNKMPNIMYGSWLPLTKPTNYDVPAKEPAPYNPPQPQEYATPAQPYIEPEFKPIHKPSYAASKPAYGKPKPSYVNPKPAYVQPKPTYAQPPTNNYVQPASSKPVHVNPKPTYAKPTINNIVKPTYTQPPKTYVKPKPTYVNPTNTFVKPVKPAYIISKPSYVQPTNTYVEPANSYVEPTNSYVKPANSYVEPTNTHVQPSSVKPTNNYVKPQTTYVKPEQIYTRPEPVYVKPEPVYVRPKPTYTKPEEEEKDGYGIPLTEPLSTGYSSGASNLNPQPVTSSTPVTTPVPVTSSGSFSSYPAIPSGHDSVASKPDISSIKAAQFSKDEDHILSVLSKPLYYKDVAAYKHNTLVKADNADKSAQKSAKHLLNHSL